MNNLVVVSLAAIAVAFTVLGLVTKKVWVSVAALIIGVSGAVLGLINLYQELWS